MKPSTRAMVLAAVATVLLCGISGAAEIDLTKFYTISFSEKSTDLYMFDPGDAADGYIPFDHVTSLKLSNGATPNFMTNAIAFSPENELYGWDTAGRRLYSITLENGLDSPPIGTINYITPVNGNSGLSTNMINGLSFLRTGDDTAILYGISGATDKLYSIDATTGIASAVESTAGMDIKHTGMAVDFRYNKLYAVSGLYDGQPDYLLKIDPEQEVFAQIVGALGTNLNDVSVEFDGEGNLYAVRDRNKLFRLDLNTGLATHVGNLGTWSEFQSTNLAHPWPTGTAPVPEPGTLVLLGSGLLGLAGLGRNKKQKPRVPKREG